MSDPMEFYPSASSSTSRRSTRSSSKRSYSSSHRRSVSPDRSWDHRRRRSPSPQPHPPPPPPSYMPSSSSDMRAYDPYYDVPRKRARTKDYPPPSPEPKPTHMLDIYHPSVLGSKVMVRTLPDIKGTQLNTRVSPHPEISQAIFETLAENKRARLVQYYMSNVRDPDVDHVIWTSVSVRALNPKDKVEAFYFGAYACCWEKPVDRRGLAAAFQGVAKTNIFAEYSAALAALQACPPGDSVLIKTSSGPIAHGLLKGTFPQSDSNGPRPPHVNIRDAFMQLVEQRRGRVYIRVVPSKSMIPVGAKVVRMAEKARRDYEASVLPESELPLNAMAKRQSPPAPTPSHIQDTIHRGAHQHHHASTTSITTTAATTTATMDRSRVRSPPPPPPSQQPLTSPTMPQHYRWNDVDNYRPSSPQARSPVESHRSRLDHSTSPVRARDPRIRRMEENMQMQQQQQQQRMEYHYHHHHHPPRIPMAAASSANLGGSGGGDSSLREQRQRRPLYNDAFSMSDNVDNTSSSSSSSGGTNNRSQMARKLDVTADSDDDEDEVFYDAKDYLEDYDDEALEDGKDVSPPRRMAQAAIAAKGSISAWVNTMFDKYHIQ
ncbi:hypothetical protein O0I10_005407 [Lichtheimia ornata]|uniref:Uncharacterized protein n=1 Tax=Lichtheimia ornata TaxID=688661 RepID=A0AAD7V669_9FUNG|nr:uncharacterized protein O0I10_005407 [Lichtheimia ornata]KAJ8659025.1 hypothetical protein O0I10_005407 [Lichtheimia ornata]